MYNAKDDINYELDDLTKILNRKAFYLHTEKLLKEKKDISFFICAVNIDRFKVINDLFGTLAGDKVLVYLADVIKDYLEGDSTSLCGRMHADAFLMCLPYSEGREIEISEYLGRKMSEYPLPLNIYVKCGIYHIHNLGIPVEIMCDRANMAIAQIKGKFSINYNVYDEKLRKQIIQEQEINNEMIQALEDGQFLPYYQPKYNMETGKVIGAEALVRWIHPQKGLVSPGIFIPVFEKNGFIANLDRYIWERVCADIHAWIKAGYGICPISVNVSRTELYDVKLPQILLDLVTKYQIPKELLQLEITESAYTDSPEQMINAVDNLKEAGFTILMDDFGSGYSSLNTLKDIPIDVLKLDLKFLYDMENNIKANSILKSVVQMAKRLSLSVIAEGVETSTQVDFLKSVGCLRAQGYFYSKPIPKEAFEEFLKDKENVSIKDEDYKEGIINVDDIIGRYHREDEVEWYRSAVIMLRGTLFEYDLIKDTLTIFDMMLDTESNELQKIEIPNFNSEKYAYSYTHPDDYDTLTRHLYNPEGGTVELRLKSASLTDGSYRWYRITYHSVKNDEGDIISFVGVLLNVSGNHQARAVMSVMKIFEGTKKLFEKLNESAEVIFKSYNVDKLILEFPKRKDKSEIAVVAFEKDKGCYYPEEHLYSEEELSEIHKNSDKDNICIKHEKDTTDVMYLAEIDSDYTGIIHFVFNTENREFEEYDKRQISEICRCLITNIEKRIWDKREKQMLEMYNNAFSSSRVMLREWDINTKTLIRSDAYTEHDGMDREIYNVPDSLIENGYVHPDFVDEYKKVFDNIALGKDQVLMCKVRAKNGCYEWLWADYKVIFAEDGTPIKAVGTGQDINSIFASQQDMRRRLKEEHDIIPGVISWINIDLTEDRIIDASGDMSNHIIKTDKYSELSEHIASEHVIKEEQQAYLNHFSLKSMMDTVMDGQQLLSFCYHMKHDDGSYQWRGTDVDLYQSREDGHFKAFAYVRDCGDIQRWHEYVSRPDKLNEELYVHYKDSLVEMVNGIIANEECENSALVLLDMDRFSIIKEYFGQVYADEILKNIVTIIKATIRPDMIIGQIFNDRFAIFIKDLNHKKEVLKLTNALQKRIFNSFHLGDKDYILSVSVGVAYAQELENPSFDTLYNEAQDVLLDSKNSFN